MEMLKENLTMSPFELRKALGDSEKSEKAMMEKRRDTSDAEGNRHDRRVAARQERLARKRERVPM